MSTPTDTLAHIQQALATHGLRAQVATRLEWSPWSPCEPGMGLWRGCTASLGGATEVQLPAPRPALPDLLVLEAIRSDDTRVVVVSASWLDSAELELHGGDGDVEQWDWLGGVVAEAARWWWS